MPGKFCGGEWERSHGKSGGKAGGICGEPGRNIDQGKTVFLERDLACAQGRFRTVQGAAEKQFANQEKKTTRRAVL